MTTDAYMTLRLIGLLYGTSHVLFTRDNPPTTINNLQLIPQAKAKRVNYMIRQYIWQARNSPYFVTLSTLKTGQGSFSLLIYRNFDICNVETFRNEVTFTTFEDSIKGNTNVLIAHLQVFQYILCTKRQSCVLSLQKHKGK